MKLIDKIKLAFSDLMNRKFRSILTIIAVSIGSLLLVVMMGLGDGIINKMKDVISSYGNTNLVYVLPVDVSKAGSIMSQQMGGGSQQSTEIKEVSSEDGNKSTKEDQTKKISADDVKKISEVEGVKEVYTAINGIATRVKLGDKDFVDRKVTVEGVNFSFKNDHDEDLVAGKNIKNPDTEVLVGENLAKVLGVNNIEDLIGKKITVRSEYPKVEGMEGITIKEPLDMEGTIVGVLNRKNYSDTVVTSDKRAEPMAAYFSDKQNYLEDKGYSGINVYPNEGIKGTNLANKIGDEFGYQTFSMSMVTDMFESMGTIVKGILSIAGIIVLVVAALGLVNTITMTLQEKKKMIGVMRSVGGSRSHIRVIFLFQSIMLGLAGGLLGAVLSAGGILFSNEYITKSNKFVISLTANNIAISILITFIIALIAGLIPASKAAKLNVVEAVAEE